VATKQSFSRLALILNGAALVVLLAGYGLAFGQAHAYETGITRQQFTISGAIPTPVIHLIPATRRGNAIAIIVHGYSGSKELMIGFGLELAKMGVPSYLMDLPGHGESTVALNASEASGSAPQLEAALDEVVRYARAHSDVTHPAIILLGHSLGTLVVGNYARTQPTNALAATMLVSPIIAITPTNAHPANVLYLVGQGDIAGLLGLAQDDMAQACGLAQPSQAGNGTTCGAPSQGTGRQLTVIAGANHITILTDADTFKAMDAWVAATSHIATVPVNSDVRLHWAEIGVLCAVLAILPLITLAAGLLRLRTLPEIPAPLREMRTFTLGARFGLLAASVALTVLILRGWSAAADALGASGLRTPLSWMHMALADYAASFALIVSLVVLGLYWLVRRQVLLPEWQRIWPQLALGAVVALALYLTVGTLATFTWERFVLDGPRVLRFLLLLAVNLPLFALIETLFGADAGTNFWRAALPRLGALLLLCIGYVGAIVLDHSLFFLSLLVPIQGLLYLVFALFAYQTRRQGNATALACATFMAAIFAWAVAAVFPIVQ
jgi:pimeloyl-ACP methyl ester carboxylesterase